MSHILSTTSSLFSQLIRAYLVYAGVGILLLSGIASASLVPTLVAGPAVNNGNGTFTFNYIADLSATERLDPAATSGMTCPGPGSTNVTCVPPGTFFTIYDIPGTVTAAYVPNGTTPAGGTFTPTIQLNGLTPSSINGATIDNPALPNVTFTYTGPVVAGPMTFTGFSITTTFNGINQTGNFTSQDTKNTGISAGQTNQVVGSVGIPNATTAAAVNISGRVTRANGQGLGGIRVSLAGGDGGRQSVITSSFGYYTFEGVRVGETYILSVSSKRYTFNPSNIIIDLQEDVTGADFVSQE